MSKRLVIIACILIAIGGCAAFDSDNTPYEGFSPDQVPLLPGKDIGIYSGYYAGTMTLDSNSCAGVSDAVGEALDMSMDVIHSANLLNATFGGGSVASAEIKDTGAIFMVQQGSTRHVYYLDFSVEDTIGGSCEVIEVSEDGSWGKPCASYAVSLSKGERPAEEQSSEDQAPAAESLAARFKM
ncbi:MAG: hypothetical protein JXA24_07560 [Proteobacteria bacterium]|nr:hypothetical protein [Pseudomonadota bacterium]